MEDFNAQKARELANSSLGGEIKDVLLEIKNKALNGKGVLYMSRPLNRLTVEGLRARGFAVTEEESIAIQKDNLYHIIKW